MGDSRMRVGIGCPKPHRLIVIDKKTNMYFLVAADSNVSFFPKSRKPKKSRDYVELGTSELFLNSSGAIIQTYGKIDCVLDIGLGREFSWTFNLSNFERPILGRDFLTHFGLELNFTKMSLFNPVTNCETKKMSIIPCECHQRQHCEDGWPSITGIYTKPIKQRFFVYEKFSKLPFLVGNTSQLCIFPISCLSAENKLEPVNDSLEIVGDLNKKSKVLGFTSLTLDFGTNRKFVWKFFVVDDYKPIIGLDFMNHFGLVRKFQRSRFYLADLRTKWSIPCDTTIDATGWPSTVTVSYKQKSAEVPLKVLENVEKKFNYKTQEGPKFSEASTSRENPKKESKSPRVKKDKKKFAKTTRSEENAVSRPRNPEESNSRINHRFHVADYNSKLQCLVSNVQISMFPKNYVDSRALNLTGNLSEIRGTYGQFLKVFGWTTKTLDLGLGREYPFRFAVVDIEKPILGNDFIRHFNFCQNSNSLIDRQTNMITAPPSEPCDCRRSVNGWPDVQVSRPRFPSWRGRGFQNFRKYPRRNYSETRAAAPQTRMRSSTPVDGESGKNTSSEINTPQLSANFSSDNLESSSLKNESEISIKIMNKSADDSEAELETNFNKESRILESIISEESPVIVSEPKTKQVIIPSDQSKEEPKKEEKIKILVKETTSEEDSAISIEENFNIVVKVQTASKEDTISIEENVQIVVKEQKPCEEEAISIEVTESTEREPNQEIVDSKISNAEEVKITESREEKKGENSVEKMDTADDVFESSDSDLEVINEVPEAIDENSQEKFETAKDSKIEKSTEMEVSSDSKEDSAKLEIKFCKLKIEDIKNDNNSTKEINELQELQELQEEKEVNKNSTVENLKESTEILDNGFSIINIENNSPTQEETEDSKKDSRKCDNSSKELESEEDFKDCSEHFEEETTKQKIEESDDEESSSDDESSEAKTAIKVDEDESSDDTSEDEVSLEGETSEDSEDDEENEKIDSKSITDDSKELIEEEAKKLDDSSTTETDSESDSTDFDSQKLVIDIETSRVEKKHFHIMEKSSKILFFITEKSQVSSFPISLIQGDSMKDSEKSEFIVADSSIFPILGWTTLKLDFGLNREYEWTFAVTDFVRPIIANDFLNHFRLECDHTLEYPRIIDSVTTKITEQFIDDCDCKNFAFLANIQKIDSIPESVMNEKKIAIELCKTPDECSLEKRLILVDQNSGLPCLISEFDISVYPKLYVGEDEKIEKFDDSVKIFNGDVEIPIYGWIVRIIDFELGRYFLWKFLVIDINAPIIGKDFTQHYDFDLLLDERIVYDLATKKMVEGSEEFYECQTKKYWPDNFRVEKMEKSLDVDVDSDDSEIGIEETEI
ncbi:uncharacterized protein LOC122503757 [Leptopilina heterotoma]|uniref:uncharacterized protein LOC122503757 n=1 Tax=Leptopilina heterotoma TaxID=63436 RepID=UPI001CA85694|nr:uncharacterized protein LOC122503757 [Leptopilina heterotoma]